MYRPRLRSSPAAEIQVVCVDVGRRLFDEAPALARVERDLQLLGNCARDLVLDIEDIGHLPVVPV